MLLRDGGQAVGFCGQRRKRKSCRSPRALPDSPRPFAVKRGQHRGNVGTGERRSALRSGKIVAETCLNVLDRRAKTHNVFLGRGGQHLHDDEPAEASCIVFRKGRQLGESRDLLSAMDPATRRIEHHNDSPAIGKADVAHNRRRGVRLRTTAVDDESAAAKQSNADARARAAAEVDRIRFDIERQAVQAANAGRHRQRELRSRTEPGVGWNHFQYFDRVAISECEALRHPIPVTHDAFVFRPCYAIFRGAMEGDLRSQTGDGKADTAETTTETAIEVEETQMQSRRNRHRYAVRYYIGRAPQEIRSPFFLLPLSGFSKTNTS